MSALAPIGDKPLRGQFVRMKLYVTYTSPYARLARIVVVEKRLEGRVEYPGSENAHRQQPLLSDQPVRPRAVSRRRRRHWHGG